MHKVDIHGCALGLQGRSGMPIKKPWSIMTTSKNMVEGFKDKKCPGPGVHATHTPCAGSETKRTKEYTNAMTDIAHEAVAQDARLNGAADVTAPVEENNVTRSTRRKMRINIVHISLSRGFGAHL